MNDDVDVISGSGADTRGVRDEKMCDVPAAEREFTRQFADIAYEPRDELGRGAAKG